MKEAHILDSFLMYGPILSIEDNGIHKNGI